MTTTRVGTVNQTVTTGGPGVIFLLKEHLKANGFTIIASGDGLSAFSAVGDVITHDGSGANGMGNLRSWVAIGDPGGNRSWTFQRGATDQAWLHCVSESISLTGGTFQTRAVSPVTEGFIVGSGSSSPAFAAFFGSTATWRIHVVSDTVPVPGSNVYPFYVAVNIAAATTSSWIYFVDGLLAGTYPVTEPKPWVLLFFNGSNFSGSFGGSTTTAFRMWQNNGLTFASAAAMSGGLASYGFVASTAANGYGVDPIDGLDWMVPVVYMAGSGGGIKGVLAGLRLGLSGRLLGNTLNLSTDPYIYWAALASSNCLCLPWIDGVAPAL